LATAASLSMMLDGEVSHLCRRGYDPITRLMSARAYTSKDPWGEIKPIVRRIESIEIVKFQLLPFRIIPSKRPAGRPVDRNDTDCASELL